MTQGFYGTYWRDPSRAKPAADPLTPDRAKHVSGLLRGIPGARVVDAGCGSGELTACYAREAADVLGLELADGALEAARARSLGPHVRFEQADLQRRWPVEDGAADVVVSSEVIEHLFEYPTYVSECARVLRPGGWLYLTTPYHGLLKNLALVFAGFERHFCDYEGGHIRFFTDRHLARLARDAGFERPRFEHLGRVSPLAKSTALFARKRVA